MPAPKKMGTSRPKPRTEAPSAVASHAPRARTAGSATDAAASAANTDTPLFPSPLGNLRDASNTAADLRDAFENASFGWATSHVLRKTTASVLDSAGMSAREIADQLGHARPSITMDRYMGRKIASDRGAVVLESLAGR